MIRISVAFLLFLFVVACDERVSPIDAGVGADGGRTDAATPDGGALDASTRDAGVDAGGAESDAGVARDAGAVPADAGAGPLRTTITRAGRSIPVDAQVSAAGAPILLLLPGFQVSSAAYEPLQRQLVAAGFNVVRADPPGSLLDVSHTGWRDDGIAVLDWALANLGDTTGIGVLGHSLGGKVAFMIAGVDPRVDAVLGIDPVNGGGGFGGYSSERPDIVPEVTGALAIPVGLIGETLNAEAQGFGMACAPGDQNFQTLYESATGAPWIAEWTFAETDHMDFVPDTSGCTVCGVCTPRGSADLTEVLSGMYALSTAFFARHLLARAGEEANLTGAGVPSVATVRSRVGI